MKKATPAQFDSNPNAVCSFECVPKDKINDALEFINAVKGIKRATRGDNDGEIVVLFAGESRFRRNITCLDGPDWRMKRGRESAQLRKTTPAAQLLIKAPQDFITDLQLTEIEQENIPVINYVYATHGRLAIDYDDDQDLFALFSYNDLVALGYYTGDHATQDMSRMATDDKNIFLMHYTELFGRDKLAKGGVIINPLNYRPMGGKVLVVKEGYVAYAFSKCSSPKARALHKLMGRVFEQLLKTAARKKVAEIGPEAFKKTVFQPAEDALQRAVIKALKMEVKAERALKETERAQKETERMKVRALEHQNETLRLRAVTHPIQIKFLEDNNQPKIGCVCISKVPSPPKLPVNATDEADKPAEPKNEPIIIRLNYSEQRDSPTKRRSLQLSATQLMANYQRSKMIGLFGGSGVHHAKTALVDAFTTNLTHSRGAGMQLRLNEDEIRLCLRETYTNKVKNNFAFGLEYNENDKGEMSPRLLFYNEALVKSLPKPDQLYCEACLSAATPQQVSTTQADDAQ